MKTYGIAVFSLQQLLNKHFYNETCSRILEDFLKKKNLDIELLLLSCSAQEGTF